MMFMMEGKQKMWFYFCKRKENIFQKGNKTQVAASPKGLQSIIVLNVTVNKNRHRDGVLGIENTEFFNREVNPAV